MRKSFQNAFDGGGAINFGPIQRFQKQVVKSNGFSIVANQIKSRNENERKTSLRRKALSVEMIKHSSEESNSIYA